MAKDKQTGSFENKVALAVKGKTHQLLASTSSEPVEQLKTRKSKLLDYRNIKTFKEIREPEILQDDASRIQSL